MEYFVRDMESLPQVVERRLSELRQMDSDLSQLLKTAAAEEATLFEDLAILAKADPDFDEGPIIARFDDVVGKRQLAQSAADDQMRKIQRLYDLVDGRITYIDSCTKEISHLFPLGAVERGAGTRKKRRKKGNVEDSQSQPVEEAYLGDEAAEPLYCTCRQISYGQMIGCENPDCAIEWYHFGCVGITAEPEDPWYCPQCKESLGK